MINKHYTMPARFLRLLARACDLQEKDLGRFLANTEIPLQAMLPGEEYEFPITCVETIFDNLQEFISFDALGLRLGSLFSAQVVGPVGPLLMNAPDIVSCLKAPAEYQALRVLFVETALSFDEDYLHCELLVHLDFGSEELHRLMTETFAVNMQRNMESVLGRPITEARYQFTHPSPSYAESYGDYIHGSVEFSQEKNVILVPLETARLQRNLDTRKAYSRAMEQCQKMMDSLPSKNLTIPDRVTRVLLSQPLGSIGEEDVAKAMYVSKRTLARRLDQFNTSYRQIRDLLLASLAAQYLRDEKLSVDAIAALLGYQDSSNFRRAFKRWYHTSPSEFRLHTAKSG